ncbi:MAG: GNAT family N-acetyltransferase [Actinomadura sp.]
MSTQRFVRPARAEDVEAIVDVQVAAWQEMYHALLPEPVLAEMAGAEARAAFTAQWRSAVSSPPTSRHRLLVAVASDLVVGFAAHGPAEDPDLDPAATAELITLLVDPVHTRAGHGSRLLAATADLLREDGFRTLITWVFEDDEVMRTFLGSAGWAPDGTARTLDMGEPVRQIRLHTDISDR